MRKRVSFDGQTATSFIEDDYAYGDAETKRRALGAEALLTKPIGSLRNEIDTRVERAI